MLRISDLKTNLLHLIGWEQKIKMSDVSIADSLTQSDSGLYFQQAHPLLTLNNLNKIMPDTATAVYYDYDNAKAYAIGDIVKYNSVIYRAKAVTTGNVPTTTQYWEVFNAFSQWLEDKTFAGILQAINNFINKKSIDSESRGILLNKPLFDGTGRIYNLIDKTDSLVGFEIIPVRSKGVTTKIEKIGLQFNAVGDVTLYLMHSSMAEPYKTIPLTITKANSLNWFVPTEDIYLPYIGDNHIGGSWYLVYDETDLDQATQAINAGVDFAGGPCNSCSRVQALNWELRNKYLEVYPFKAPSPVMWEIQDNIYTFDNNYGINLELSILCDLTDFIIEQKHLFVDIIHKQVAVSLLREMAFNASQKLNRTTLGVSKADILYEIDGDSTSFKKSGLSHELSNAIKTVDLNTRGINGACMPCKKKGVRYRTIG